MWKEATLTCGPLVLLWGVRGKYIKSARKVTSETQIPTLNFQSTKQQYCKLDIGNCFVAKKWLNLKGVNF
jgi:hypothetical protein